MRQREGIRLNIGPLSSRSLPLMDDIDMSEGVGMSQSILFARIFFADVLLSMQTYIVGLFCGSSNRRVVIPSLITALGSER